MNDLCGDLDDKQSCGTLSMGSSFGTCFFGFYIILMTVGLSGSSSPIDGPDLTEEFV